jgi:hypothetical protein
VLGRVRGGQLVVWRGQIQIFELFHHVAAEVAEADPQQALDFARQLLGEPCRRLPSNLSAPLRESQLVDLSPRRRGRVHMPRRPPPPPGLPPSAPPAHRPRRSCRAVPVQSDGSGPKPPPWLATAEGVPKRILQLLHYPVNNAVEPPPIINLASNIQRRKRQVPSRNLDAHHPPPPPQTQHATPPQT